MDAFEARRRQQHLNQQYYNGLLLRLNEEVEHWKCCTYRYAVSEAERTLQRACLRAQAAHNRFLLQYTGGLDLVTLRESFPLLLETLEFYASLCRSARTEYKRPVLRFANIGDYERAIQLISLCYLLHRMDLLPRVAQLLDSAYRAQDAFYEHLLAYAMINRPDVDNGFHETPYRFLLNSLYRDNNRDSISDINSYLEAWYPSMCAAPWYDSHFQMHDEQATPYVGYWAIEAAAITLLLGLDDTSYREHPLYPKDLVDFAHILRAEARLSGN